MERNDDPLIFNGYPVEAERSYSFIRFISNRTHLARVGSCFGNEINPAPPHTLNAKEPIDLDLGSEPGEKLGGIAPGNYADDPVLRSELLE
jgi:hypothetical protein